MTNTAQFRTVTRFSIYVEVAESRDPPRHPRARAPVRGGPAAGAPRAGPVSSRGQRARSGGRPSPDGSARSRMARRIWESATSTSMEKRVTVRNWAVFVILTVGQTKTRLPGSRSSSPGGLVMSLLLLAIPQRMRNAMLCAGSWGPGGDRRRARGRGGAGGGGRGPADPGPSGARVCPSAKGEGGGPVSEARPSPR